jgi:hypothetical protein
VKQTKKIWISGFSSGMGALDRLLKWGEEHDMERLALEAKKGYVVEKIGFRYHLRYQGPQDLIYAMDYQDQPGDDYFELFKASGWDYVDSLSYVHLFKAPTGTKPLYSDIETTIIKYMHELRRVGRYTAGAILYTLVISFLISPWLINLDQPGLEILALILLTSGLLLTVFTIIPFFNYWIRVNKLKKGRPS